MVPNGSTGCIGAIPDYLKWSCVRNGKKETGGYLMDKLKTAIIGCGKVGHLHARALQTAPESLFSAVCSRDQGRRDLFARQYGVTAFENVEEMISRSGIQVLHVCTPHPVHAESAVKALRAGVHVLVEKPLASSLADCDAMLGASRETGARLGVVSQRRFYAPCQRIKKAIEEGRIGLPVLGIIHMLGWRDEAYYRSDPWRGSWAQEGGGVLVNQAPHQLDLLQWFMGPIQELYGFWDNLNHPYIEVEDTAVAVLRFKNGAIGNIVVSNSQNPALYGKVHVHGKNGASLGVQTDGGAMFIAGMSKITEPPVNDLWTIPGEEHLLSRWQKEDGDFFQRVDAIDYYHLQQTRDFLQAILEGRDPMIPGEEGRVTVEIFTAIYRSQKDRIAVQFPVPAEGFLGT
jgi:UDP-N-acetyl-2-amino-2-deoxyglucuronate dehydrogenase